MGRFDKDRYQKELAIRYCLARKLLPFPEVLVPSFSDVSDSVEILSDLDVVGIEFVSDGEFRRTIFDCKTTNKMSAVNRAFWAAGVMEYVNCQHAFVILKNKAVHNHRISSLSMGVDLHTEASFIDLGKSEDVSFPVESAYQSSIERWNRVQVIYENNVWASELQNLNRNVTPLARSHAGTFRRYIAELRSVRGVFDPAKVGHFCIFLDCMSSLMVLWASLARDARRFYEPGIPKADFEKVLRYYLWGGKEQYQMRQQMREKAAAENSNIAAVELPAWEKLVSFVGLVIAEPKSIFECAYFCRELAFRVACGADATFDIELTRVVTSNTRVKQFSVGLADYLISACGIPRDMGKKVQGLILAF